MPENVRDRDELLLNAIVTGDTSGIDPRDREERFIKAIAEKNVNFNNNPTILTLTGTNWNAFTQLTIENNDGVKSISTDSEIKSFLDNFDFSTLYFINMSIGSYTLSNGKPIAISLTSTGYEITVASVAGIEHFIYYFSSHRFIYSNIYP